MASGTTAKRIRAIAGRGSPGILISLENHVIILQLADKAERSAADGVKAEIPAAARGDNAKRAVGKVPQQRRIRLLQMDDDRRRVGRVDVIDLVERACALAVITVPSRMESRVHFTSRGGQRFSVLKAHAGAQMKEIGKRIGRLPARGEPGFQVEVLVLVHQAVEDQAADMFRLRVDADAWIEAGGAALDQHGDRLRDGLRASAACQYHR